MKHRILIKAEGESSNDLRSLLKGRMPEGCTLDELQGKSGGFEITDPFTIGMAVKVAAVTVPAIVSAIATIWAAKIVSNAKVSKGSSENKESSSNEIIPSIRVSTYDGDINIPIKTDVAVAVRQSNLPTDPQHIIEIRLETKKRNQQ